MWLVGTAEGPRTLAKDGTAEIRVFVEGLLVVSLIGGTGKEGAGLRDRFRERDLYLLPTYSFL